MFHPDFNHHLTFKRNYNKKIDRRKVFELIVNFILIVILNTKIKFVVTVNIQNALNIGINIKDYIFHLINHLISCNIIILFNKYLHFNDNDIRQVKHWIKKIQFRYISSKLRTI